MQVIIRVLGVLLLVALSGCATLPGGGYGNQPHSSSDHQH